MWQYTCFETEILRFYLLRSDMRMTFYSKIGYENFF